MRIKSKGYEHRGFELGQRVIHNDEECVIIGFDETLSRDFIALYTGSPNGMHRISESKYATSILKGYENETYWNWVSPNEIEVIHIPIIGNLKELDSLENGMGLVIEVVDDLFVVRYKETSDLIRN